jgi:hypothetical protein
LGIAIFFILFEGSGNYVFEEDTPAPTSLRGTVVSYALGVYNVYIKRVSYILQKGSFDRKLKVLVPFYKKGT